METSLLHKSPWTFSQAQTFTTIDDINQDFSTFPANSMDMLSCGGSVQSSASSECDEDLLPILDDIGFDSIENELFNNLGGWLTGPLIQDQICGDENWDILSITKSDDGYSPMSTPPHSSSTESIPENILLSNISWSSMSESLQVETVERLTEIISSEMDLREQLEIIKIIDSDAVVSPTDTEFAIDLNCLNDEKLEKFRSYVYAHIARKNSSERDNYSSSNDHTSPHNPQSSSYLKTKHSKKEIAKERKTQIKAAKQRKKKEYKQLLKEKKSGLFMREEVLALSTSTIQDDESIDIDIGED